MRWYEGGIAEAVSLSRKNNAIFVVYVEGKDDKSAELTKIIDGVEVSSKLESDSFVAIKIEANSVPHQQFSEIYNQVNVPSIYFIGKSGAPLEIIEGANDTEEFAQKIDNILKKNGTPVGPNKSQATSDFILHESKTEAKHEDIAKASDEIPSGSGALDDAKTNQAESGNDPTDSINNTPQVATDKQEEVRDNAPSDFAEEDKVERAKALIEKKRQEKQQEEEEKERNKELERRKMGQDVQKLKRWQQDQELKNIIEEREREKKEQLAARQRILAQIEQDKADRAARFSGTPPAPQAAPQSTPQPIPKTPVNNNNTARLQFKLPDGSSHTHEFSNTSSLLEVRNYIRSNLNLSFNNFTLATAFPRREFTSDVDSETLQELELVPTAVILILPIAPGTVASSPSTFTSILWYLIAPVLSILGYIKNMIFSGGKPQSPEPSTSQENKRPHDGSSESSRPLPKRRVGETSVIRRQGNVHRLTDKSDSDDENNTWNGNSTQQM